MGLEAVFARVFASLTGQQVAALTAALQNQSGSGGAPGREHVGAPHHEHDGGCKLGSFPQGPLHLHSLGAFLTLISRQRYILK